MNRDLSEKWPPAKARYTFPPTIRPAIQGGSAAYGAPCAWSAEDFTVDMETARSPLRWAAVSKTGVCGTQILSTSLAATLETPTF
jgi:hypothetical protein